MKAIERSVRAVYELEVDPLLTMDLSYWTDHAFDDGKQVAVKLIRLTVYANSKGVYPTRTGSDWQVSADRINKGGNVSRLPELHFSRFHNAAEKIPVDLRQGLVLTANRDLRLLGLDVIPEPIRPVGAEIDG
jgi:hypothetical protein